MAEPSLPAELETRIREVQAAAPASDFDASSWFWMILLGALLPAALIVYGWVSAGGAHG